MYIYVYVYMQYNIYILDSSHEGIDGSMSLLGNRAARQSSQPVVVSQSSCQSVDAASRGIQSSHSVEAASRGQVQSRQPKILPKSVPGGVGSPRAVPSVPQERQDSTEELIRSAPQRLHSSPERPKSAQRSPDRAPRAAQSGPK